MTQVRSRTGIDVAYRAWMLCIAACRTGGALLALLLAAAFTTPARAAGIVIGFSNCQAVANYPQSLMDEIAQFTLFFSHASVGANMISGLNDLNTGQPTFYRLHTASDDDTPPATTAAGYVYEYQRGNPGWQAKMTNFAAYVKNGWRFPKVHAALDKLCYIDPTANTNDYLRNMQHLETAYPQTLMVYMTMPLQNTADQDNFSRNRYNDAVRSWVRSHNRVLYDVADIEAHDSNGVEYTFTYSGRVCQQLYNGITTDGGHLNAAGCRQVARGFYALLAALLRTDRDGDGMPDGDELIAGTCPTNAASSLRLGAPLRPAAGKVRLEWPSTSNRCYRLQRATNLTGTVAWTSLLARVAATPPLNTYTDNVEAAGTRFYRIAIQP